MKEIIAFFIVSGGVGFLNLYIAQETDFLYFGKYNKEERVAWLSIFTVVNYLLIKDYINIINNFHSLFITIATGFEVISLSALASFALPKIINRVIDFVRKVCGQPKRTYLPPINSFFKDIKDYQLYSFDFDGKIISSGKINQGTEERQENLSVIITPNIPDEEITYFNFLQFATKRAMKGKIIISEFTDYNNKIHFVKIKKYNVD